VRVWRTIRLVAGGGMVVVLGAAAMMLWPLLWPPDPDASVQLVNGRLIGETSGYVGRVDRAAQTVDISSSLVGWRPIIVVVNDQTAITVQNRQGGFGDLLKDLPVRISYEVVGDRRLAKSIDVVTEDSERARAAAGGTATGVVTPAVPALPPVGAVTPSRPPADAPAQAARPPADLPAPRAVDVRPPRADGPAPPTKAPTEGPPPAVKLPVVREPVAPTPPPAAKPPALVVRESVAPSLPPPAAKPPAPVVRESVAPTMPPPAAKPPAPVVREPVAPAAPPPAVKPAAPPMREASPRVEPPAPRVSAPVVAEPPTRVEPSAPRGPAPRVDTESRPARPAEPEAADGAAAIDWLLKRGR